MRFLYIITTLLKIHAKCYVEIETIVTIVKTRMGIYNSMIFAHMQLIYIYLYEESIL